MNGKVYVFHEGTKDIKGTGEKRWMGEEQFKRVKKNGWTIIPATSKPKSETGSDSGNSNENADNTGAKSEDAIDIILKDNAKGVVAKIKELAEAKEFEVIHTLGLREAQSKDPRSTVAAAVAKYETEK